MLDTQTQRVRSSDVVDSAARKEKVISTMSANKAGEDWLAGRWMRFQPAIISPDDGIATRSMTHSDAHSSGAGYGTRSDLGRRDSGGCDAG